ncbi:hypothetical protein Y032_0007g3372 [Ancylostoma ceylanicum]|uniref:Tyr recombinase domain-containing protein n=1 Tax=Ancylostoma ceylanicum TaxID=53326 RepID=A0A016VMR2_9BILA|nr:hypothetical protein Y032_0007g3372 [Ancylostoma ceylanicum]
MDETCGPNIRRLLEGARAPALAYERLGRKPEEASKWAVLDEVVRARRKSDGEPWRKDRAHVLLVLLFYGPLRISEAVSLEGEDFTMETGYWMVRIRVEIEDGSG